LYFEADGTVDNKELSEKVQQVFYALVQQYGMSTNSAETLQDA
jgi:hypothetical protein